MKTFFAACLLAAAVVPVHASVDEAPGPARAIALAQKAAPAPVKGVFEMDIKAVGHDRGQIYLNSEDDYRSKDNLSIHLLPSAEAELKRTLAVADLDETLKGRRIRVDGKVRQVKIWFLENGVKTDRFYYQTHVLVRDADQIRFIR
ncbi:hypothetical protein [Undibacterium sp.]|uniref:hypothetical protein n=1 Tax=Undibacterium sp. TaxID=1914977 RepID=UPI00374CABCB